MVATWAKNLLLLGKETMFPSEITIMGTINESKNFEVGQECWVKLLKCCCDKGTLPTESRIQLPREKNWPIVKPSLDHSYQDHCLSTIFSSKHLMMRIWMRNIKEVMLDLLPWMLQQGNGILIDGNNSCNVTHGVSNNAIQTTLKKPMAVSTV